MHGAVIVAPIHKRKYYGRINIKLLIVDKWVTIYLLQSGHHILCRKKKQVNLSISANYYILHDF